MGVSDAPHGWQATTCCPFRSSSHAPLSNNGQPLRLAGYGNDGTCGTGEVIVDQLQRTLRAQSSRNAQYHRSTAIPAHRCPSRDENAIRLSRISAPAVPSAQIRPASKNRPKAQPASIAASAICVAIYALSSPTNYAKPANGPPAETVTRPEISGPKTA